MRTLLKINVLGVGLIMCKVMIKWCANIEIMTREWRLRLTLLERYWVGLDVVTSSCSNVIFSCCFGVFPANIYLFKVNNRNTRNRCEISSKLTIKTPERRRRRRSGVFIVNFEHISHIFLVFLLLTLNK